MKTKQPSVIVQTFDFVCSVYITIGLGIGLAFTSHLMGLGTGIIPGWVGYSCIPLIGIAGLVAGETRDFRGLALGALVFVGAVAVFGYSEILGPAPQQTSALGQRGGLTDTVNALLSMMAIGAPLFACVVAIVFPGIARKKR